MSINPPRTRPQPIVRPEWSTVVDPVLRRELEQHVLVTDWENLLTMVDQVYNWGRRSSLWPLGFGLACCAIEMICTASSRFDLARFGAEVFRGSPRQADVMIVSGTVTKTMMPTIARLYDQMPEPKYVIAMGACASGGGPFKEGYNVVPGIDKYLPVDVYIPGCPPSPQALLHGIITLQKKIDGEKITRSPWYRGDAIREVPVPVLGPDLIDLRLVEITAERAALGLGEAHEAGLEKPPIIAAPTVQDDLPPTPEPVEPGAKPKHVKKGIPVIARPSVVWVGDEGLQKLRLEINARVATDAATTVRAALLVPVEHWLEVARFLRNQYDYLANLTAVHYADAIEIIYHLDDTRQPGRLLQIRVRAAEANAVGEVPSVVAIWPGADFQEREVFDLFGVQFAGHPDLRRIMMWDGFEGHPMRKDYLEPFYEGPTKALDSRIDDGRHFRAEERSPFRGNIKVSRDFAGWDRISQTDPDPKGGALPNLGPGVAVDAIASDEFVISMGPQHPSTHGVFRMNMRVDGETIVALKPVMGYMHRNHEKIAERNTWLMNMPFTDRLDYLTSLGNNFGYALAVEQLLGDDSKPPERAEYIRVIMAELTRVVSHLWSIGFLLNDLGAFFTPALYAIEERELILDLFESATGSRMMCNYFRFGGVAFDLPHGWLARARALVEDRLPGKVDELDRLLSKNEILLDRCVGIGVISADEAVAFSTAGPVLRASGVKFDLRRDAPYGIYDRFEFDVITGQNGDVYDRYLVRLREIRESLRILRQALREIPTGPILPGKKAYLIKPSAGEAYSRVENPKGELGFYVVSDGTGTAYRYHVRSPSFVNLTALEAMCLGHTIADSVAVLGSLDIILGEVDR